MSDTRPLALHHAIAYFDKHGGDVIQIANLFNSFLNADGPPAPLVKIEQNLNKTAKPAKPPKPAKSEEQLVQEAAERIAKTEAEAETPAGATKEAVGKAVEAMLKANKRKEAVALLKKFGAESVSSLAAANYDAFVEEADGDLMSA
jgi:hypothetical protein